MSKLLRTFVGSPFRRRKKSGARASTLRAAALQSGSDTSVAMSHNRIGVWDLGAYVAHLDIILDAWNRCQKVYRFEKALISVPHQITLGGERTRKAAQKYLGEKILREEAEALDANLFIDGVFSIASDVRRELKYDYLALVTPHMLAFTENNTFYYNYYSLSYSGIIFASAYEMREFAARAKRPFEAAIGGILLSQILAATCDQLHFHPENRGCLFDFNEERKTIVATFKKMQIEPSCLDLIPSTVRGAVEQMARILREYRRD